MVKSISFSMKHWQEKLRFVLGAKDCVSFYECFRMICAFDHGSLVKDVVNKMKANNIDEK